MNTQPEFFGQIQKDDIVNLTEEELLDFLVEKGFYQKKKIFSFSGADLDAKGIPNNLGVRIDKKPTNNLLNAFYSFVLSEYEHQISTEVLHYLKDFEFQVLGLEYSKAKELGVEIFKEKLKHIYPKDIEFISSKTSSENMIYQTDLMNSILKLQGIREAKKSNLSSNKNLLRYLIGDYEHFESKDFVGSEAFKEAFTFEVEFRIILSINDKYQIEPDEYYSELSVLKKQYKKYVSLFVDFETYCWAMKKIQSLTNNIPTYIESMYQALQDLDLIYDTKKSFIEFVKNEFGYSIKKIRNYEEKQNRRHDFRVKKYKEELREMRKK